MLELKVAQNFSKVTQNSRHICFYLKSVVFKVTQIFGVLLKENLSSRSVKIAQSGHTDSKLTCFLITKYICFAFERVSLHRNKTRWPLRKLYYLLHRENIVRNKPKRQWQ